MLFEDIPCGVRFAVDGVPFVKLNDKGLAITEELAQPLTQFDVYSNAYILSSVFLCIDTWLAGEHPHIEAQMLLSDPVYLRGMLMNPPKARLLYYREYMDYRALIPQVTVPYWITTESPTGNEWCLCVQPGGKLKYEYPDCPAGGIRPVCQFKPEAEVLYA